VKKKLRNGFNYLKTEFGQNESQLSIMYNKSLHWIFTPLRSVKTSEFKHYMKKYKKISFILLGIISTLLILFCICRFSSAKKVSCAQWMGQNFGNFEYETDKFVIDSCDDRTFKVLDHEYAKDKEFVYYKPMPNAYNMTVILKGADPKSFKLLKRCSGYAMDKNHVFSMGKIVEDKDPNIFNKYDSSNPKTFCN